MRRSMLISATYFSANYPFMVHHNWYLLDGFLITWLKRCMNVKLNWVDFHFIWEYSGKEEEEGKMDKLNK